MTTPMDPVSGFAPNKPPPRDRSSRLSIRSRQHIERADSLIRVLDTDGQREEILIGATNLRGGIVLDGRRTAPASIAPRQPPAVRGRPSTKSSWWTVVLKEGRTRQIREMFFRIGHPVGRLRRVAIGPLEDRRLPRGGWRELEEREVASLYRAAGLEDRRRKRPRSGHG